MHPFSRVILLVALAAPAVGGVIAAGCGGSKANVASGGQGGSTGTLTGGGAGDGGTGGSKEGGPGCFMTGAACATAGDCCTDTCTGGVCNLPACTADTKACTSSAACCSGTCAGGTCTPLNTSCKTLNNPCAGGAECCSGLCFNGLCSASSFCIQGGDVCSVGTDCCSGICTIAAGATKGTCGAPPSGSANCGLTDGMLCGGTASDAGTAGDGGIPACGGACCSRLCAPYGPTDVLICQPASGCHVVGDLCTKDADCCGSAGLPGEPNKPVTCEITPPNAVGVCLNPMGCKPDGDICKLATMSCNASCDCCSGNCENENTCNPDSIGVPRCTGLTCVQPGGSCASSANCCNDLPCVPNPVDGGMPPYICFQGSCVPKCGLCTVNADCCPGETCILQVGSAEGVCGPCQPPPDGGSDSGSSSSSSSGDASVCSLYGQQCTASSQCCNSVPCTNTLGNPCGVGEMGCTCHVVVQ